MKLKILSYGLLIFIIKVYLLFTVLFSLTKSQGLEAYAISVEPKRSSSQRETDDYVGNEMFGNEEEEYQQELFDIPRYMKFGRII